MSTSPSETSSPSELPFRLVDVLVDGLASLREDWRAHLGWSLIWIAVALTSCCGSIFVMGLLGGLVGATLGTRLEAADTMSMVLVIYAVLIPLMVGLYALHQTVAMEITRARGRGAPVTMREAIQRGLRRAPALGGHLALRAVFEGVPMILLYAGGALVAFGSLDFAAVNVRSLGPFQWAVLGGVYVVVMVLSFGYRGYYGLCYPCIVDGTGPFDAFARSRALLAGRRWQCVGMRLFVMLLWLVGYCLCTGPYFVATMGGEGPDTEMMMATLPFVLGFYAVAYVILLFDAVLEASFYVRVTKPTDTQAIARTFE